jgi:hypothetical protein
MKSLIMISLAALLTASCSASMPAGPLTQDLKTETEIDGIPYRVTKRFTAVLYQKQDDGTYKEVDRQYVTVADPKHLEVIGFEALPLSSGNVSISFNEDNTLKEASLTSASTAATALTQSGQAVTTVVNQLETSETAKDNRKTAETAATSAKYALVRKAIVSCQAWQKAVIELDALSTDPSASAAALFDARKKAELAMFDASTTAAEANVPACEVED